MNTTTHTYTTPAQYNNLATYADLEAYELALEDEDEAWFAENVEGNDEVQGSLFTDHDGTYLTILSERIDYLAFRQVSAFYFLVEQENPNAPCLEQPIDGELLKAITETTRLECALGITDPWK